jgi:hypothetical protein
MHPPTPTNTPPAKNVCPLLRVVATAFPQATVEAWALDEHWIGLRPRHAAGLGADWAAAPRRRAAPVPLALPRRLRPSGERSHPLAPWFRASSVSIPVFEAELRAFAHAVGAGPKKQIVLVLDQASWHTSLRLRVPDHVHLLFLPAYSPELQPAEHVWPLTNDALVNAHFVHCVALQRQPDRIRSATLFPWWPRRVKKRQGPRWT